MITKRTRYKMSLLTLPMIVCISFIPHQAMARIACRDCHNHNYTIKPYKTGDLCESILCKQGAGPTGKKTHCSMHQQGDSCTYSDNQNFDPTK